MSSDCLILEDPWRTLAIQQLNEQPELNLQRCSELLHSLNESYPSLLTNSDPSFILRFLRLRKFGQEKAFKALVKYYKFRRDEKLCWDLKPSGSKQVFKLGIGAIMPGYDIKLRKLFIVHVGQWDPNTVVIFDALRSVYHIHSMY